MRGAWTIDRRRQPNGQQLWTDGREVLAYCPQIGEWLAAVVVSVESRMVRITAADPVWFGCQLRATKLQAVS